ncbi:MAG: hypothetical protein V1703_00810 [Candidatus Altiarchaeota archaeon]
MEEDLSPEGKSFIEDRMKAHERIEKMVQVIDVITAMSSLTSNPSEEVKSILAGESKAKMNFIVDVVKTYRTEKPDGSITDFFNKRYREKAMVIVKPTDAIREAIRTTEDTKPRIEANIAKAREEIEAELRNMRREGEDTP